MKDSHSQLVRCFECGEPSEHRHHVVPKSEGGTKTLLLCEDCHGKVHDRKFTNHKEMTRKGLKKAKARGVVLGKNGRENGWKLAEANRREAMNRAKRLTRVVWEIRNDGHRTIREIAAELNRREIPTARGGKWRENTTHRLLSRIEQLS